MNVIAIPIHSKPELLYINFEQLFRNPEIYDFKIRLYADPGYDKQVHNVVLEFERKFKHPDIKIIERENFPCQLPGMYNILTSYHLAATESDEFVILLEEDIIPTADYLRFNIYVHEHFLSKYDRIFCVAHKRRPENELDGDPEILIGDNQCTSPTCITKDVILKYLTPHLQPELFANQQQYYYRHFRNSRIPYNQISHHDVFIERIIDVNNMFALKPDQARSMHIGLSGLMCRGKAPTGNLQDKIKKYKYLMKHPDKLRGLSQNPKDMVVTNPKGPRWHKLEIDYNRTKAKASSWWYDKDNLFKKYMISYE